MPSMVNMRGGGRPAESVVTIQDAVDFHRAALARLPPGSNDWGHRFGLANAAWEMETPEMVREAADLAWELIMRSPDCLPGTHEDGGLRAFLMDVLMELGDWPGTIKLLGLHPNETCEEWVWGSALALFKVRGGGATATAALERAIRHNPHVYELLSKARASNIGNAGMENPPDIRAMLRFFENGTEGKDAMVMGTQSGADTYCRNYKKHWWCDADVVHWLRKTAKKMIKEQGGGSGGDGGGGSGGGAGGAGGGGGRSGGSGGSVFGDGGIRKSSFAVPDSASALCSWDGCDAQERGEAAVRLSRCSGCRKVQYCCARCQKLDWKEGGHKQVCKVGGDTKKKKKKKTKKKNG